MSSRPVVTPDPFSGEGSWDDWLDHFESVAEVNKWENPAKLLWLRVRMTGRAQTAFKQLPQESREDYATCIKALRERFEPESKRELYLAEFQTRSKRKDESWAAFADDLKVLANRAFPKLQDNAKQQLALTHYLGQLDNVQIAFSVKQKRPKTLDEAVSATLELESYLFKPSSVSRQLPCASDESVTTSQVVAGVRQSQETMMQVLTKMMERLDKLETKRATPPPCRSAHQRQNGNPPSRKSDANPQKPVVCLKCGKEGHYARGCAAPRSKPPGN